ncbi:hypothetical protein WJX72_007161 [[Myrmecia] bisecta]|uniref:Protein kinase domain-containing protein n=1 Tax=[Myrmecia] bisecta TaxID=41462 RepID=A0AAW1P928_9CHLO
MGCTTSRWERLAALRALGVPYDTSDAQLDDFTRTLAQILEVPIAVVKLVEADTVWIKSCFRDIIKGVKPFASAKSTPRSTAFCAYTLLSAFPEVFVVPDLMEDARFTDHPSVLGGLRFYAGCPLVLQDGARVGTLCIMDVRPHHDFDVGACSLMVNFAALITRFLESASAHTSTQAGAISAAVMSHGSTNATRDVHTTMTVTAATATKLASPKDANRAVRAEQRGIAMIDTATAGWPVILINTQWTGLTGMSAERAKGRSLQDICCLNASSIGQAGDEASGQDRMQGLFLQGAGFTLSGAFLPVVDDDIGIRVGLHFRRSGRSRRMSVEAFPKLIEFLRPEVDFLIGPGRSSSLPRQTTASIPVNPDVGANMTRSHSVQPKSVAAIRAGDPTAVGHDLRSLSNPVNISRVAVQVAQPAAKTAAASTDAAGQLAATSGSLLTTPATAAEDQPSRALTTSGGGPPGKHVVVELGLLVACTPVGRLYRGARKGSGRPIMVKTLAVGDAEWQRGVADRLRALNHINIVRTYASLTRCRQAEGATAELGLSAAALLPITATTQDAASLVLPCETLLLKESYNTNLKDACDRGYFLQDNTLCVVDRQNVDMLALLMTAQDVALGMQHLHKQGLAHGLLEAANVALVAHGRDVRGFKAKVAGLDLVCGAGAAPPCGADVALPVPSLAYLAPELFGGPVRPSQAGDVFAFGVLLWVMYTAQNPWAGLSASAMQTAVVTKHLRPVFPPATPAPFMMAATACMAPNPADRPSFTTILGQLAWALAAEQAK